MFGKNDSKSNRNVTKVIDLTSEKNNSAHAAHFMVHSLLLLHNYDVKNS